MTKKKNPDEIRSQGSARKVPAAYQIEIPSGEWTVGSIAWNEDGRMILLDPKLASLVEKQVRDDKGLALGIPPLEGSVSTVTDGESGEEDTGIGSASLIIEPQPAKGPIPLTLCPCDVLQLKLIKVNQPTNEPMPGPGLNV